MAGGELGWYSGRCVFKWKGWAGEPFEERITLWQADSLEDAIELAEREAVSYAGANDAERVEFSQAYALADDSEIGNGAEIFSLIRDSELSPEDYIDTFFATGEEHTRDL